jgi:hypothetical protein
LRYRRWIPDFVTVKRLVSVWLCVRGVTSSICCLSIHGEGLKNLTPWLGSGITDMGRITLKMGLFKTAAFCSTASYLPLLRNVWFVQKVPDQTEQQVPVVII